MYGVGAAVKLIAVAHALLGFLDGWISLPLFLSIPIFSLTLSVARQYPPVWHFHFSRDLTSLPRDVAILPLFASRSAPGSLHRWRGCISRVMRFSITAAVAASTAAAATLARARAASLPSAGNSHIAKKHLDIKGPAVNYKGLCLKHLSLFTCRVRASSDVSFAF